MIGEEGTKGLPALGASLREAAEEIERYIRLGDAARARMAANSLLQAHRRLIRDYADVKEAKAKLSARSAQLSSRIAAAQTALKSAMASHESSLRAFEKFRAGIEQACSMRTLAELPQVLAGLARTLDVNGLRVVLSDLEYGGFVPENVPTHPAEEIEKHLGRLIQPGWGSYIGPVSGSPDTQFFLGGMALQSGTCFIRPLPNKYAPEGIIGAIAIYSADPSRYSSGKATDFLEHFCDLMAWSIVMVRDHDHLERESLVDGLTGVHNRLYLMRHGQRILDFAARKGFPVHLLFLDLDQFKPVNDSLGHAAGDRILKAIGALMQETIRRYDILVRYGGDEFVVLTPYAQHEEALAQGRRLQEAVASLSVSQVCGVATDLRVTASVGLATYAPGETLEELLRAADADMYHQKRNSRESRSK